MEIGEGRTGERGIDAETDAGEDAGSGGAGGAAARRAAVADLAIDDDAAGTEDLAAAAAEEAAVGGVDEVDELRGVVLEAELERAEALDVGDADDRFDDLAGEVNWIAGPTLVVPGALGSGVDVAVGGGVFVDVGQGPPQGVAVAAAWMVTAPSVRGPGGRVTPVGETSVRATRSMGETPVVSACSRRRKMAPLPVAPGTSGGLRVRQLTATTPAAVTVGVYVGVGVPGPTVGFGSIEPEEKQVTLVRPPDVKNGA